MSGDGYFIALKWGEPSEAATSLKVGLQPSEGTGLVEAIDDPDRNVVAKVTNTENQKFVILQSNATKTTKQVYDLSGLTLENGV